jgi:hypothetical protein
MNVSGMSVRRIAWPTIFVIFLAGCAQTQLGPTVASSAGPGKSFDMYQADLTSCKGFASTQVQGSTAAMNQRVVDSILSGQEIDHSNDANDHAYIQQQYDSSFSQCMVARGENIPGMTPVATAVPYSPGPAPPDPTVRATQVELIRLGLLKGAPDGYKGPRTRAAIVAFEQQNSLPPDGVASPRLLAKMQASSANASTAASSNWVAPTTTAGSASAASSNWVAPTDGTPASTTASQTPAWVNPTK